MRAVDAAELLGARMHMHERNLRAGNVEQRVTLRRQFAEPAADHDDKVGGFDAFEQFRIGTDAEVAGVTRMRLVEQRAAAERRGDRQRIFLRETAEARGSCLRPTAAAKQHDRRPRGAEHLGELRHCGRPRRGLDRRKGRRVGNGNALDQHVLGDGDDDRSRPSVRRRVEGARDDLRHARRIVDLGRPFGHRAEHRAIIDLLEGLALTHVARDLADEHDERARILLRDMDAVSAIGGAGAAGDEADAGTAGHFADGFGHHRGAGLLPAHRDGNIAVMKRVEHRQIALAGHAKDVLHAVDAQLIDQNFGGAAQIVLGAHFTLLGRPATGAAKPLSPGPFRLRIGTGRAWYCLVP